MHKKKQSTLHYICIIFVSLHGLIFCANQIQRKSVKKQVNLWEIKKFLINSSNRESTIKDALIKLDKDQNGIIFGEIDTLLQIDPNIPMGKSLRDTLETYPVLNDIISIRARDVARIKMEKLNFILTHFKAKKIIFKDIYIRQKEKKRTAARPVAVEEKEASSVAVLVFDGVSSQNMEIILKQWRYPGLKILHVENSDITSMRFLDSYLSGVSLEKVTLKRLYDLVLIKSTLLESDSIKHIVLQDIPYLDAIGYRFLKKILQKIKDHISIDAWIFEKINLEPYDIIMRVNTLVITMPSITRLDCTLNEFSKKVRDPLKVKGFVNATRVEVNGLINHYTIKDAANITVTWLNNFIICVDEISVTLKCGHQNGPLHTTRLTYLDQIGHELPRETNAGARIKWMICDCLIRGSILPTEIVRPLNFHNEITRPLDSHIEIMRPLESYSERINAILNNRISISIPDIHRQAEETIARLREQ
ncbi:hypothetical protein NERG_01194 [Nematocida ausubeli]|uniref:Uncharacterized protein n=1 Tax=Nematocida ausubeli (strain ATCC PRA-371 / ERTm2) TaxID=1913371 RepID=H8ZBV1_NEMA1|nr:hypothetical protein NERG_01194 [Nematocida ausubeli]